MIRCLVFTQLLALHCLVTSAAAQATSSGTDKLSEGWRKDVRLSDVGDQLTVWVENGWLQVRRQTAAGELEWQIVLAKATEPTPPTIDHWDLAGSVNVAYASGRYFVRDFGFYLRAFREKKDPNANDWPRLALSQDDYQSSGWAQGAGRYVQTWRGKSWFLATLGPAKDASDCLIRLNHLELTGAGFGVQTNRDFLRAFHGETELFDEGDLLFCKRVTFAAARTELANRDIHVRLLGSSAPDIDGKPWLNTPAPLSWKDLQGKVVLIDFWGTWCKPCVEKLPHTEVLYQKYKDRGFVVIGVHSVNGADDLGSFLEEHKIHFPVVVDDGDTAKRYAIEAWPTYFLVDRKGKVRSGFKSDVPAELDIEELLNHP